MKKEVIMTKCNVINIIFIMKNLSLVKTPLVLAVFLGLQKVSELLFPLLFVVCICFQICIKC